MSTTSGVGSSTGSSTAVTTPRTMSPQDFLKVIFTELQSQDPLQPTDSNALMQQISTLQNIQSQMDLQTQISSLVLQNKVASAGNLIGKIVQGLDGGNNQVTGVVSSVLVQDKQVLLQLQDGSQLSMDNVTAVANLPAATGAGAAASGAGSAVDPSALAQELAALLSGSGAAAN